MHHRTIESQGVRSDLWRSAEVPYSRLTRKASRQALHNFLRRGIRSLHKSLCNECPTDHIKSKRAVKSKHSPSEEIKAMRTHQKVSIGINFQQVSIVGIKHQASVKKAINSEENSESGDHFSTSSFQCQL